jgi:excisionase family DNA binding protein
MADTERERDARVTTDRLLTVEETAQQLSLSTETIRRWLRDGRLRGVRLGERRAGWRIAERDLAAFIHDRIAKTEQSR